MAIFICHKCQTRQRVEDCVSTDDEGKLKCAECGAVVRRSSRTAGPDEGEPRSQRKTVKQKRRDETDDEPEERPAQRSKKKQRGGSGILVAAIAGGAAVLLLVVVGTGIFIYQSTRETAAVVHKEEPKPADGPFGGRPESVPPKDAATKGKPSPDSGKDPDVPAGWRFYKDRHQEFTVWLPQKGKFSDTRSPLQFQDGDSTLSISMTIIRVEQEGGPTYSLSSVQLPKLVKENNPAVFIKRFMASHQLEMKAAAQNELDIKHAAASVKEYVLQNASLQSRARIYVTKLGNRVTHILRAEVYGTKTQVEVPEAQIFLDSIKITPREN